MSCAVGGAHIVVGAAKAGLIDVGAGIVALSAFVGVGLSSQQFTLDQGVVVLRGRLLELGGREVGSEVGRREHSRWEEEQRGAHFWT